MFYFILFQIIHVVKHQIYIVSGYNYYNYIICFKCSLLNYYNIQIKSIIENNEKWNS